MDKIKVTPLIRESILAFVKNSVGSNMFRNLYAEVNGERKDILEDGRISCAAFVSAILLQFGLIKKGHATVDGTIGDMEDSGWIKIDKPKEGCVLLWEPMEIDGSVNKHIGFYINNDQAISNSFEKRTPQIHHWTYNDKRKITAMYWHNKLDD